MEIFKVQGRDKIPSMTMAIIDIVEQGGQLVREDVGSDKRGAGWNTKSLLSRITNAFGESNEAAQEGGLKIVELLGNDGNR
jgi:hypothetical protein